MTIYYRAGYDGQLARDFTIMTPIIGESVEHEFFRLHESGELFIRHGYAWDYASGPVIQTENTKEPSLVHDVFCQMMRLELLSYDKWQDVVNQFFYEHLLSKGMWKIRAKLWHMAVEAANAGQPNGEDPNPIIEAP